MSLFRTDPLLAFCRLLSWLILICAVLGCGFCLLVAGAMAVDGEFVLRILRTSYPALEDNGLRLPFALSMIFIGMALALVIGLLANLVAIIRSVAAGEAFTLVNAARIRAMAWISLAAMPVGLFMGGALSRTVALLGPRASDAGIRIGTFDGGFSSSQALMTLLLFVLARLFAQAAAMRDEIAGTV